MAKRAVRINISIRQNNDITPAEIALQLDLAGTDTVGRYLREARSRKLETDKKLSNVSIETLEPIILDLINKNPNTHNVKLALDLIKIKQSSAGMEDDIDIEAFIKISNNIVKAEFHEDSEE